MRFKNGSNKVVTELRVVQFWSEIVPVISNRTRAARSFDFEITRISDFRPSCTPLCSIAIINIIRRRQELGEGIAFKYS